VDSCADNEDAKLTPKINTIVEQRIYTSTAANAAINAGITGQRSVEPLFETNLTGIYHGSI
jgi:hypothetical protein